ncbi:MAG: tRNA (adenosine(37)-N6)-threonylcarbamoyltransferase complex transferase subunit TsaD [Bacteroidales bacterium]|mgnify:CR=1 FL=1|nr:tRNA (adenosine(37)-N6)-threonylcarbamoyltransferase complex transferase subunit TsaD [Bacteroidales bacterium]HPO66191.1 tRNA (adenosine(37)-N6)-threonylcarbamoyltransferase complex transferase subunit TsaD [Bacteroidales bacterium]
MSITILGIESSCDDTSAAIVKDGYLLSNVTANQQVHEAYGGVVPELASRVHQQHIVPVVDMAIKQAGINRKDISAVAFTRGPGLLGSLLVGTSFAKGFAIGLNIPLIDINHLQGHVLAHFIKEKDHDHAEPNFPFLSLLVSGGHTQLIVVKSHLEMEIIGQSIDDAAGEAFDKCAKMMGLPYPGGPVIDKLAQQGNPDAFTFGIPQIADLDFSFSGLKTSFLYFLRDRIKEDSDFIDKNLPHLCASLQHAIVQILMDKLIKAFKLTGLNEIALAGGVAANSGLRSAVLSAAEKYKWKVYLPKLAFTTDNAAMIAITGYYKYLAGQFASHNIAPVSRFKD